MIDEIKLSAIIVSNDMRTDYINSCLKSLVRQKTGVSFEVILVLSGDGDSNFSISFPENIFFKIINVDDNNYCLKRNAGANVASAEIVAYIDDDAIAVPEWVDSICNGFKSNWTMAGGSVEPFFNSKLPKNLKGYEQLIGGFNFFPEINYRSDIIIGCNMFYRRQWLLENDKFDEKIGCLNMSSPRILFGGDEVALMRKLNKDDIGYIQEAKVKHLIQNSRLNRSFIISRALANGRAKRYHDSISGIKTFGIKKALISALNSLFNKKKIFLVYLELMRLFGYYSMRSKYFG